MANAILTKADKLCRSQVGYREGPRNNETKYGAWFGMNFVAWCAIFLSWISFNSGLTYLGKPWRFASTISARNHAKKNHRWTATPTVGTFAMMAHSDTTGHIGYVIALLRRGGALIVVTIEGNTNDQGAREGNGVWIRERYASSWDGYIVLDQTYAADPPADEEDDMKQRFYKIRDEANISQPHPTKGDAIYVSDGTETKFVSEPAWVHFRNLGWWSDAQVELIPESAHAWLISDSNISVAQWLAQQIKDAAAGDGDGGPGYISPETIDAIAKAVLDAEHKRMES